jgi:hypothetical protein
MNVRPVSAILLTIATLALSGCYVSSHKSGKGGDNVDIGTPFGGMHVKTNKDADTSAIGLTVYPGAVPAKDDKGKDNDAADINMNFGDFHLGVKAATFTTTDSPAKVEAFYRNDMKRYGDVIKCHGDQTIGTPVRTSQGLTCKDEDKKNNGDNKIHANVNDNDSPELRAGSPKHQHIVGIEPKNGGTKIGLVMLDLPGGLDFHDKSDSE